MYKLPLAVLASACVLAGCTRSVVIENPPQPELSQSQAQPQAAPNPYEQLHSIDGIVQSRDGSQSYFLYTPPEGGTRIIRLQLPNTEPEEVFWPIDGAVGVMFLSQQENTLALTTDAVGDEHWKLNLIDIASGRYRVVTPRDALDIPCTFDPNDKYVYSGRGEHIWGPREIVRIDTTTGAAESVYSEPEAMLDCLGVSPDGRSMLLWRYISNEIRHLGLLDLRTKQVEWFSDPDAAASSAFFYDNAVYYITSKSGQETQPWRWVPGEEAIPVSLPVDGRITGFYATVADSLLVSWRDDTGPRVSLFQNNMKGGWQEVELADDPKTVTGITLPDGADYPILYFIENGRPPVLYSRDGEKTTLVLDTDASGLPDEAFAQYESVLVESYDGLQIPTHILKPPQASAENPLPMLLYVHGGPEDHVDATYSAARQIVTNAGFVAVMPNVRGSSGFGQDYADMDDGDWGGDHIRDLLAVADYAAGLDYVADGPRFIMGGSFGGFSVLSAITQYPDAFDGAVDLFGISDLESFVAGLPEGAKRYFIKEIGFDPADDPERAKALSPLYAVDRIKTPLQIHQGIRDPRVLPEQSRKIVEALRQRGAKVEYYEYDAGHGFIHKEDDQLSQQRMIDFLQGLSEQADSELHELF